MNKAKWIQKALNELAVIWTNADPETRKKINEATKTIDKELGENPRHKGESRPDDTRILIERPLGVLFRVAEKGHAVVRHVWFIHPHKKKT